MEGLGGAWSRMGWGSELELMGACTILLQKKEAENESCNFFKHSQPVMPSPSLYLSVHFRE